MRPKMRSLGIFKTKRRRAVRVSRFTRMLVPNPNKAFQSPGTQILGLAVVVIVCFLFFMSMCGLGQCGKNFCGVRDPPEDPSLGLDHFEAHFLKFRKVRAHTIRRDKALVTAIISLTHSGVDANFCGHAGDDELLDSTVLENGVEVRRPKSSFARLVNNRFASDRIEFRDDVMALLSAN